MAHMVFNFFCALGSVVFAYGGHSVVMEFQATMPSFPNKPSKARHMWKAVLVAYIVVTICYVPIVLIEYSMLGNAMHENILITLEKPTWLIVMANMFIVVHLIGSYQIYAMPVFDMMEIELVKKMKFRPTCIYGMYCQTFPFFNGVLAFFGGFDFEPNSLKLNEEMITCTIYLLIASCLIWFAIHKPGRFSFSLFDNWVYPTVITIIIQGMIAKRTT